MVEEYRARCAECTYSRRFGMAELTAKTKGTVHALTKMHKVLITKGNEVVDEISPKVTQGTFDTPGTTRREAPF